MAFFEGKEAIAVVKVPEELYNSIMKLGNEVGKLIQEDPRSGKLVIDMPDNTKRNYRINLATADKKSIIFGEKDGEFKVHYISKFNGICIADDEDDLVLNLTHYIEDTRKELDSQDIKIADKAWEAAQRRANDYPKSRQKKADTFEEGELKDRLFSLFGSDEVISFDDLRDKTNAAKGALEKALKEIADFSKDTRTYRLKEQYRRTNTAGSQPTKKVKSS